MPPLLWVAMAWIAPIGFDRALGYGLKRERRDGVWKVLENTWKTNLPTGAGGGGETTGD